MLTDLHKQVNAAMLEEERATEERIRYGAYPCIFVLSFCLSVYLSVWGPRMPALQDGTPQRRD